MFDYQRLMECLDVEQARDEVARFVNDHESLSVWSREFFRTIAGRMRVS